MPTYTGYNTPNTPNTPTPIIPPILPNITSSPYKYIHMANDQENLENLYESILLTEMPHIAFRIGNRDYMFDFRFEYFKNDWEGMIDNIKKYFSEFGSQGGFIKRKILDELRSYPSIDLFLKKTYGKTFEDLEVSLLK